MLHMTPRRLLLCLFCWWLVESHAGAEAPPNIVILFADDLGYSDLGCYGGEIETPHLDRLAAGGLRWTQFYNTARCWPSRASLLTGYYPQQIRRDALPGLPGGSRGVRPDWSPLLPELLQKAGYRSYHSGKWHIDGPQLVGGFQHSLSVEDHDRFFYPQRLIEDDRPLPPMGRDTGYYVTTGIADHAIRCLQEHAARHPQQPFFSYVAFTAPHFPLHAPESDIARYRERYKVGWKAIRQARHQRQREMGLLTGELSAAEPDVGPPYHSPEALAKLGPGEVNRPFPWNELTPEQQEFQAAKMAVHAAMVDRMDQEIGRILAQLDAMQATENTLILFLSDNGASAEIMVRGDGHDRQAAPGSAASYLCLGPGWSNAANTPFRRHKTWVHEGGIATPLIATWPRGITARGALRHTPGHVVDVVPTILELTRAPSTLPERATGPQRPGRSLVPQFASATPQPAVDLWWLHEGNRALRKGDWKLVAANNGPWELYNLADDRAEQHDRSGDFPARVAELAALWEARTEEFRKDALTNPAPQPSPAGNAKKKQ